MELFLRRLLRSRANDLALGGIPDHTPARAHLQRRLNLVADAIALFLVTLVTPSSSAEWSGYRDFPPPCPILSYSRLPMRYLPRLGSLPKPD